jgi:hypothetical protein
MTVDFKIGDLVYKARGYRPAGKEVWYGVVLSFFGSDLVLVLSSDGGVFESWHRGVIEKIQ